MNREIHLRAPKDHLQSLMKGDQKNITFQTDELGFPLRIVIWSDEPKKKALRFTHLQPKREPKGDEDDKD